jgi:hypothetical protein
MSEMDQSRETDAIAQRLQPEWRAEYDAYLEAHQMGFESYESSIHQDGFAAGWTLGTEIGCNNAADALAAERRRVAGLAALLKRCMNYLDYRDFIEDRGNLSARKLRSDVLDAIGHPLSATEEALTIASDGADAPAHAATVGGEG